MKNLYEILAERLSHAKRIAILGVGSSLNADDGAGVKISEGLKEYFLDYRLSMTSIFTGENAPENYTGEIKKFKPDHLLVLDAIDSERNPGDIVTIKPDEISGVSFSTHMLPIKIMLDYLVKETGCDITIIGIQPKNLVFAGEMTYEVIEAADYIMSVLRKIIIELEPACKMVQFKIDSQA